MKKIKQPSVAGTFYSNDVNVLRHQLEGFAKENKNTYEYKTRAVIVPHAGLVYSGRLAYEGISQLDRDIKNIIIFAPAHKVPFKGLALSSYDKWEIPTGNIEINQEINTQLIEKYNANFNDDALKYEHSIEIELPVLNEIFKDIKIVPVLIGDEDYNTVTKIIDEYYNDAQNGFIISSDLSHFLTDSKAKELDNKTAEMIENGDLNGFSHNQACGATGIAGLVEFANKNDYSLIRIDMQNSSAASGDVFRVVGYGCWFLYEGTKNEFLKKYYSEFIINLCKTTIDSVFTHIPVNISFPDVFKETGACFVTLKEYDNLRGCIGSIIAHRPLIDDIISHAKNAAFNDTRFTPVTKDETDKLKINVSLLSVPKKIYFRGENDLLSKIVPHKDGIIIKDKMYQAVYLPSVWEELPDKNVFLKSLKMKAGLSPDYFSTTFEAYRFYTEYIEEN